MVIIVEQQSTNKAAEPFEVRAYMTSARRKVWISMMMELCQRELDGKRNAG